MIRPRHASMAGIGLAAMIIPAIWLATGDPPPPAGSETIDARAAPAPPPLAASLSRPLFSNSVAPAEAADNVPALIGIVGRMPHDGIALVRDTGRTRALRIGDDATGWRLIALSAETAIFERGGVRRAVALPAEP